MSSINKALDALYALNEQARPLRLSELASLLAMPRSSTHRVLVPLVKRGLVERDSEGRYCTGIGLIALGLGAATREPLAMIAKPHLETAAADLDETFFLVVARAGQLIVLEKAEGNGFVRAAPQLGATLPIHATAVGKLFLAYSPDSVRLETLPRFTAQTLTSKKKLKAAVEQAQQDGFAVNAEEWQPGLCVVAAPILLRQRLLGCVALALVTSRYESLGQHRAVRRVCHAAEGIALAFEENPK